MAAVVLLAAQGIRTRAKAGPAGHGNTIKIDEAYEVAYKFQSLRAKISSYSVEFTLRCAWPNL